jgi:hypothetical protein
MFNIEDMQTYLKATAPPVTSDEYHFFENNEMIRFYEADMQQPVVFIDPMKGEPALQFHEFVFLLSRIAISTVTSSGSISGKLNDFFVEQLGFQKQIDIQKAKITFDDVARRLTASDDEAVEDLYGSEEGDEEGEWDSDGFDMDENQKKLMEFLAKKAEEEKDFIIDYETVIQELEMVLP